MRWRAVLRGSRRASRGWENMARACAEELGWKGKAIRVRHSSSVAGPVAVGLRRPVILLPSGENFGQEDRRLILLHECAHFLRRDLWLDAAARWAVALHWFNPFVWMARAAYRRSREDACDTLVIAKAKRQTDYARLLFSLATREPSRPFALAMANGRLEGRIRRILSMSPPTRRTAWAGVLLCGLALAAATASVFVSPMPPPRPAPTEAELRLSADPFPGGSGVEP